MTTIVSAGASHIGKWPLPSNQWSSAVGKAACARAACRGEAEPVLLAPPDDDPAGPDDGGADLLRSRREVVDQRVERRRPAQTLQFCRDHLRVERPRTRGELTEQCRARCRVPTQRRQARADGPQQATGCADGVLEEGALSAAPEAAGIERDHVTDDPAAREFEHDPRTHGAADDVNAGQAGARDVPLDAADQTVERSTVGFCGGGAVAGEVDRNDLSRGAERVQNSAPRSPTPAQAVDQKQRPVPRSILFMPYPPCRCEALNEHGQFAGPATII